MQKAIDFLFHPPLNAPPATLLMRLMAGSVFFWEGLLKLVYTNQGVGRFTKLGIPSRTSAPISSPAWRSAAASCSSRA